MSDTYGTRSLREIVRILFQHRLMLLLVVVVGTAGTYAVCQIVTPTYLSKIALMFKRPLRKSPISTDKGERALEVFVKAQQQIVLSDLVLARARAISGNETLRRRWSELGERWSAARVAGGSELVPAQEEVGGFLREDVAPEVMRLLEEDQVAFGEFQDFVKLETPGGEQVAMTESFTIIVKQPGPRSAPESHKNATYAADILADMYIVRYQELQRELSDPAIRVMQNVMDAFDKEAQKYIDEYERFVEENSADVGVLEQLLKSGTEHGTQVVLTEIRKNDARLALDLARDRAIQQAMTGALPTKVFEAGGIAEMTDEEVAAALASIPTSFLIDNVGFGESQKELAKLEAERAEIETQYTPQSRNVRYLRGQIHLSRRQMLEAVVAQANGLGARIEARQQQKAANEELVRTTAAQESRIHKNLAKYARLKNAFQVAQRHAERLAEEKVNALSDQLRARESVTITKLSAASVPDRNRPVTPKTLIYTVVAFLVSTLLGIAGAFLADHYDHTLRSAGEAERYLGLPVLGSVKKRGRGLVTGP